MVTLSHNGELSFFTNVGAFKSAMDAAENGDIVYLSQGNFVIDGGSYTIKKRLSIVGNGYGSHIFGKITIDMASNPNSWMDAPLFDGVRLDDLEFYSSPESRENLGESEIRRCWIRSLKYGSYAGTDVTYDKCLFENVNFTGEGNVVVKNSKIQGSGSNSNDDMYKITAINCNILNPYFYPSAMTSCILCCGSREPTNYASTRPSIINSLLDFNPTNTYLYTLDCYYHEGASLLDSNMDCSIDLTAGGYLGEDKTVVGIYGGEYPFSENPSVPSVDTEKSSVEYDADTNKLKVSITVKAD